MNIDKMIVGYLIVSAAACTVMVNCAKNMPHNLPETVVENNEKTEPTTDLFAYTGETSDRPVKGNVCPLQVEYAFLDVFGIPHVIVKNNGEQVYGYSLAIKYFDKDKKQTGDIVYQDFDAVIPAGLSEGLDRFIPKNDEAVYISAAVTGASYIDRTEKYDPVFSDELLALDDLEQGGGNFDCSFIKISSPAIVDKPGDTALSDLRFDISNNSERAVAGMELLVAEYDKDGKPVSAKPNSYICEHIRKLSWEDADLKPDAQKSLAATMVLSPDCASVEIAVNSVDFQDRGVWINPAVLDWILSRKGSGN